MMRMFRRAATEPFGAGDASVQPGEEVQPPEKPKRPLRKRIKRWLLIFALIFVLIVAWLAITAPLSKSLEPVNAPSLTILSAEGEPIARRGAIIDEPVDVEQLPDHVWQPFVAIEDRNFHGHFGVSIRGTVRALLRNFGAGEVRQGGSTITQQLAKTSFLSSERTMSRKVQEALIAFWLEAWLSKEEILSRYLSNVYFGDNVYGLRAAARHYFNVEPEGLTLPQAAMLAGVVNAPSRLAPTRNLRAAQQRARLVISEMVEANMLSQGERDTLRPARLNLGRRHEVPTGTYFADWVLNQISEGEDEEGAYGQREIRTTLDGNLQRLAVRTVRRAGLGRAQVALVAMRPDGRVVAMVGGKNYSQSPFNRATQARRQPGSAFKLFVYLAAFRAGVTPETIVNDAPVIMGTWRPQNYEGRYRGAITVREAVAVSSNSVAIQMTERVGRHNVIRAARDLGITTPLRPEPTLPLGTANVTLIEMTSAYAAVAAGHHPVRPFGLAPDDGWFSGWWGDGQGVRRDRAFPMLRDVLYAVTNRGTGTAARLDVPTFGKTGTTQDYRDAWFFGFAGDLVVGVWVGNDDNSPMPGVSGGSIPARIWRNFMAEAIGGRPQPAPETMPLTQADKDPVAPAPAAPEPAPATAEPAPEPGTTEPPVGTVPPPTGEQPQPAPPPGPTPATPRPDKAAPPPPRQQPQPEKPRPNGGL